MKKYLLVLPILTMIVLTLMAAPPAINADSEEHHDAAAPPPDALDALYPPNAEGPVYLFKMFGMAGAFSGIVVDVLENDMENANANFEAFKAQYMEISKLVPEWEHMFLMEPVDQLGEALKTGNPEQIMPAVGGAGKVCGDCHHENMVKVQQKYHWKDFESITVQDPLTSEEIGLADLMMGIEVNFVGIGVDLQQGQLENAQQQFQGFNARFQALKKTCETCHDTDRMYYIDDSVQAMIDQLGQALDASPIDPEAIGQLSQGIGGKSCGGCHLVHLPAAFAKKRWEHWEGDDD